MTPIISFTGKSGVGKTTLLEKLIAELTARGKRVGLIKHTTHEAEFDGAGKDTLRLRHAGAAPVAMHCPGLLALFQPEDANEPLTLEEIVEDHFIHADIVITEGYKSADAPQVLVLGASADAYPADLPENVIAVVCDAPVPSATLPVFTRQNMIPLADFIVEKFLKEVSRSEVRLWVDGRVIPLKPFVKAFIGQTVKGMIGSLKGAKAGEKIHVKIGR